MEYEVETGSKSSKVHTIQDLEDFVNYSGLYLNNTGEPVKLVYNREWYDSDLCLETFTFRVLGPKWITGVKNICEGNI